MLGPRLYGIFTTGTFYGMKALFWVKASSVILLQKALDLQIVDASL